MDDKVYYPETIENNPFEENAEPQTYASGAVTSSMSTGNMISEQTKFKYDFPVPNITKDVIGSSLDTKSKRILGNFTFGSLGAIAIGNYEVGVSGDIRISPVGLVARNTSGEITFAIDGSTGDATFAGTISAGAVIAAEISANQITSGFLASARIEAGTITAEKLSVNELSAIVANLGTVTAGSMSGVDITIGSGNNVFKADSNGIYLGNATFASAPFRVNMTGDVTASSITITNGNITTGSSWTGNQIAEAYIGDLNASKITAGTINASVISVTNLNASNISTGTLSASRIGASTITADKLSVANLSAISADFGNMTAGTITGVTITGGTFRTAVSGQRVVLSGSTNTIDFYDSAGTKRGTIYAGSGVLEIDAWQSGDDIYLVPGSGGDVVLGGNKLDITTTNGIDMNAHSITDVNQVSGSSGSIDFNNSGRVECSTHFDPNSAGSNNLGGSTRYWQDVSYKTLTDRGCLGWFDEGVELQDGRVVPDTEALLAIKMHPTKKTIYGKPMLDYSSLPKHVYKKAEDHNGKILPRDENDEPYAIEEIFEMQDGRKVKIGEKKLKAQDGAETTALISILLGSIKELTLRVKELEKIKPNVK